MLFNSFEFALFLPVVFILYWTIGRKQIRWQNVFLLIASYVFYGWWDWRFLGLIFLSSCIDYAIGLGLGQTIEKKKRQLLLAVSITANLGMLGFFKYYGFFVESFGDVVSALGGNPNSISLQIILPVGISFYTFQTMSYTIDIYRNNLKPTKDAVAFFAFVSFFPQLVAGPIERATNLIPQFLKERSFDFEQAKDGMRQILWGLFKKVVVADSCAVMVNEIFGTAEVPVDYATLPGGVLFMGAVYFAFQIYGDFSGYSDIAIGVARLFGFKLMRNFAYPYFSRDIGEFWRRWHISLSTWFRDYLYIPLGGSRGGRIEQLQNVMVIFVVSGFWHGANATFVIWGALNALYFIPLLLAGTNRKNLDAEISQRLFPPVKVMLQILITFILTCFAWIFFRALSKEQAFEFIGEMFTGSFFPENFYYFYPPLIGILFVFIVTEWVQRKHPHPLYLDRIPAPIRWAIYLTLFIVSLYHMDFHNASEFIYFQF